MAVATPAKWVGKGDSAANPRLIESVADYEALFQYPVMEDYNLGLGDRDGFYYKLTTDLDLLNVQRYPLGRLSKEQDGKGAFYSSQKLLAIKLDGDGHTITNGKWVAGEMLYGGLISRLGAVGTVSNLHVTSSSSTTSSSSYSGGFVGFNAGTITACSVISSSSTSPSYSGGFVGYNTSTITACSVTSSSSSTGTYSGGFVGYNTGTITACSVTSSSSSTTSSSSYSGGFVGSNYGPITACSVTSSSSTSPSYSGGFVGHHVNSVTSNCFASCTVGTTGAVRKGFCGRFFAGTLSANFWDSDYNTTVSLVEGNATAVTTAQAKAGFVTPISDLSSGSGAGYWYYKEGYYPQLWPFTIDVNILCIPGATSGAGILILVNGEITPLRYLSGNFTFINGAVQAISENSSPTIGIFGLGLREPGIVSFSGAAAGQFSVSLDGVNYSSSVYVGKGPSQIYIKYTPSGAEKAIARLLTPY